MSASPWTFVLAYVGWALIVAAIILIATAERKRL